MPSPPNQISGHISIAGHPAPDLLLSKVWLDSESDTVDVGIYKVLTDVNGYYEINIGAIGTDVLFEVFPSEIPGFVTPAPQPVVVSGAVGNIDFAYAVPADSLFGVLKDDAGTIITIASELWCQPRFAGASGKNTETDAGAYKFYFGAAEQGEWEAGVSSDALIPDYLIPSGYVFDNSVTNSIEHDFVCPRTDTVLYIKVTENGGLPANSYRVYTFSNSLFVTTEAITGTGSDNVATLHISSLDMSTWSAWISDWDDSYPMPDGFVVEAGPNPELGPGDTATINLVSGHTIIDTVTQDPEDGPIVWSDVWVVLSAENANYGAEAGAGGVFTVTADTGTYAMTAQADGYLTDPAWRTVAITGDTTGGLGFTINKTHCRVSGSLTNVATPLDGLSRWVTARTGSGSSGYNTSAQVDNATGTYTLWLCDGDWTITAPFIDTYISPTNANLVIGEMPDTLRALDLVYTVVSGVNDNPESSLLPTEFALEQNYPNPFNPKTQIRFDLPQRSHVALSIYNVLGQEVAKIWNGDLNAGSHALEWDGNDASGNQAASGIYFYRLKAGDFVDSKKMILLK
jgi:hypothetical protein